MSASPPRGQYPPPPQPVSAGEPFAVTVGYYRTPHELTYYLRAFRTVGNRWVVVAGLRDGVRVSPADVPANARLIVTAPDPAAAPNPAVGWFDTDPLRAVLLGVTGLRADETLMLLFPADWSGPSPDDLVEQARRHRAGPHRREDDEFFQAG